MGLNRSASSRPFSGNDHFFSGLEARRVAEIATAATDIAVLLDRSGVVLDVAHEVANLPSEVERDWIGKPFVETVTLESRPKIEQMLEQGSNHPADDGEFGFGAARSRVREINHPFAQAGDLPIGYRILTLGREDGSQLALGHDLRPVATLQQSLVEAQLSMEREVARHRSEEARYRLAFEHSSDPTLIVSPGDRRIVAANRAFVDQLAPQAANPTGTTLSDHFPEDRGAQLDALLERARESGAEENTRLASPFSDGSATVSVAFFRRQGVRQFVLRVLPDPDRAQPPSRVGPLESAARALPDAILICDREGRIRAANEAFVDLVELPSEAHVLDRRLDEWVGDRPTVFSTIQSSLARTGHIEAFATRFSSAFGTVTEIELSGARIESGGAGVAAYAIRRRDERAAIAPANGTNAVKEPIRSASDMTGLVGQTPLREIVRETADIIERLCIEAALEITRNNRAAAAEMLGLSRQSLYSKLRRYEIGETDGSEAAPGA